MDKKSYDIQLVSKVTGINHHTLRAWEKRYQAVVPKRNASGRRSYNQQQVDRLGILQELVNAGSSISSIAGLDDKNLKQLKIELRKQPGMDQNSESVQTSVDLNSLLQNLIVALKGYKLDIISHELEKLRLIISPRDFALSVLAPLMAEVGSMSNTGQISIGQEHALSSLVRFHVGQYLFGQHIKPMDNQMNIVISTPEGETHEFGILISALLCAHYRIRCYYLGTGMPYDALAMAAEQIKSKLILIGISKHFESKHREKAFNYIENLASKVGSKTKIWAGGFPTLPKNLDYGKITSISTLQMLDYELARI